MARWKQWLFAVIMLGLVAHPAYFFHEFNLLVWKNVDIRMYLAALGLMVTVVGIRAYVKAHFEWADWWLGRLIRKDKAPNDSMVEEPLKLHPLWCLLYLTVLGLALPTFAAFEEQIFREFVVASIVGAFLWSIVFAVAHLIMMVKLHSVVALFLTGFVFSMVFLRYGLHVSVQLHFAFNTIGILGGAAEMQYRRYREKDPDYRLAKRVNELNARWAS